MIILDWRPAWERHFSARWAAGNQRSAGNGGAANPVAGAWARVVDRWLARRAHHRQAPAAGPLVVSVGNLALGGTGKTPVIMALARDLAARQKKGCILTRGFRSPLAGPLVVDPGNELAGDEARLMAGQLDSLGWPVVQSRNRALGLPFIAEKFGPLDFILLEDGHQTRGVGRHLDILILDRWQEADGPHGPCLQPVTGSVFPLGPYRESARGAARAQILLVESDREIPERGCLGQLTATFGRRPVLRPVGPEADPGGFYAVLSGIARPAAFERSLVPVLGKEAVLAIRLRDHQEFSPRLVRRIVAELDARGGPPLVTTAKDWVKLQPFWPAKRPAVVADLELDWGHRNALPQLVEERGDNREKRSR